MLKGNIKVGQGNIKVGQGNIKVGHRNIKVAQRNIKVRQANLENIHQPQSHGEGINIFIDLIEQGNTLDYHVINTVNVKLHLTSTVTMTQT